jgi:hypothetical protein
MPGSGRSRSFTANTVALNPGDTVQIKSDTEVDPTSRVRGPSRANVFEHATPTA